MPIIETIVLIMFFVAIVAALLIGNFLLWIFTSLLNRYEIRQDRIRHPRSREKLHARD